MLAGGVVTALFLGFLERCQTEDRSPASGENNRREGEEATLLPRDSPPRSSAEPVDDGADERRAVMTETARLLWAFEHQETNPEWEQQAELRLRSLITESLASTSATIADLDCRGTSCKVEIATLGDRTMPELLSPEATAHWLNCQRAGWRDADSGRLILLFDCGGENAGEPLRASE